jgi:hypothetical protein
MSANPVVSARKVARGTCVAGFAAVLAVTAAVGAGTIRADAAPGANPAVQVSVAPRQSLAVVPGIGIGINGSTYDGSLLDKPVPGLLRSAGIRLVRIPGGTESDQYNWKANTDVLSGSTEAVRFDQFMSVIRQAGAQAMVTVDYGTGNTIGQQDGTGETGAQIAADWVRYANVTRHYNVKYWEIGNEVYGNGTFGANWEPDAHCQTASGTPVTLGQEPSQTFNCGPAVYAANAKQYIAAMKAVDPTISVGVVLTASGAPNNWPDGVTSAQSPQSWNQTVLSALGDEIGFADVHWYPQNPSNVTPPGPTDAGLLADAQQIAPGLEPLRTELAQFAGRASIPIMVTETNSVSSNPGKQILSVVNALYLQQDYLTWLENGAQNVDWWQIHNGIVTSGDNGPSLFGNATYGDYGVLSDGSCGMTAAGTRVCEPPADTPFAAYYGLQALSRFIHPGDTLVKASSSQSLVQAYATRARDGVLRVMVVNDDPATSYDVTLAVPGYKLATRAPVIFYGPSSSQLQELTGPAAAAAAHTTAPYSVTVYTLTRH